MRVHIQLPVPGAIFICTIFLLGLAISSSAQATSFVFQGRLIDGGVPANGKYEMRFTLFDSVKDGSQVGPTQTLRAVDVRNGNYSAPLEFDRTAFSGPQRFIEIVGGPAGSGSYTMVTRRSQVIVVPEALGPNGGSAPAMGGAKPIVIIASDPVAAIDATNSAPGITNASPTNIPPAAVRGEATATNDTNVGLLGIGDGATGAGVVGLSTGIAPVGGQGNAEGVLGISTAASGKSIGVSGQVNSPDGIGVQANSSNGARLFVGSNNTTGDVFTVDNLGRVTSRAFFNQNGSFGADRFGNLRANAINVGPPDGSNDTFVVGPDGSVGAKAALFGQGIGVGPLNAQVFVVQPDGTTSVKGLFVNGTTLTASGSTIGVNGSLTVTGSFSVTGSKSALVKLPDGRKVLLYAMESPENWFEDFGTVKLRHGRAFVAIDKTFAETSNVGVPYKVFLTPNGNCRGLYIARKTAAGFEVRELGGGRSNIVFDYRIVARRKGYEKERFADAPPVQTPK